MAALYDVLIQEELELNSLQLIVERYPSIVTDMEDMNLSTLNLALTRSSCSVGIVKLLLDYGAEPNFTLYWGSPNPLLLALTCKNDRVDIIKALIEGGARADQPGDWSLFRAISINADIEIIKLLLISGADLFRPGLFGQIPFFNALKYLNVSVFKSLLDLQEVDIKTIKNETDGSVLHSILENKEVTVDVVEFLIDRGIEVDSVCKSLNTPLHMAVQNSMCPLEVFDLLLRKGSLVSVQNESKITPLDIAIQKNYNLDVIKLLLKYFLLENPELDVERWIRRDGRKRRFSGYAKDCKSELQRMKSEKVGNVRTLFEFLQIYSRNQMNLDSAEGFNVTQLLKIIAGEQYPLYSTVIGSKLERSLLNAKVLESNIFTFVKDSFDLRCVTRKVLLDCDCVSILADYFNDNDLCSLIAAFCN